MKINAIIKRVQKVFAPRKSHSVNVTLPAPVEVPNAPKREDLQARIVAALRKEIRRKLVEFVGAAKDYDGEDGERERLISTAEALGFGEVQDFNTNGLWALCATLEYHEVKAQINCGDTDNALADIAQAVKAIECGDYFFVDVGTDESLGEYILDEFCCRRVIKSSYQWILEYVDVSELGKDFRNDNDGMFTDVGYFQYGAAFDYVG